MLRGAALRGPQERRTSCCMRIHPQIPTTARWICALLGLASAPARADLPIDLQALERRAAELAQQPFHEPSAKLPAALNELTYDEWRDIRFRESSALWADAALPFRIQFFHPGFFYDRSVRVWQ